MGEIKMKVNELRIIFKKHAESQIGEVRPLDLLKLFSHIFKLSYGIK